MKQTKLPAGSACSFKDMLNILTVMEEAGLPMLCVSVNDGAVARRPLGEALAEAVKVGAPETATKHQCWKQGSMAAVQYYLALNGKLAEDQCASNGRTSGAQASLLEQSAFCVLDKPSRRPDTPGLQAHSAQVHGSQLACSLMLFIADPAEAEAPPHSQQTGRLGQGHEGTHEPEA